jgi:hypothetical protein
LGELEEMLNEQGVVTTSNAGMRIAADNVTRYVYIKGNFILIACWLLPEYKGFFM